MKNSENGLWEVENQSREGEQGCPTKVAPLARLLDKVIITLMLAILVTLAFPLSGITAHVGPYEASRVNVRQTPDEELRPAPRHPGSSANSREYTV